MTETPKYPAPTRMTFKELQAAMGRGTRLCSEHAARDTGREPEDSKVWIVCLAKLPASLDTWAGRKDNRHVIFDPRWNLAIGHEELRVPDDSESRKFFEGLNAPGSKPHVYHATKEMVFIRLDIARFTQFPEELQPRVIAEVHEVVAAQLGRALWPDDVPGKGYDIWSPERVLHTGDGFILAFTPPDRNLAPLEKPPPLLMAMAMAKELDRRNDTRLPIHFRISVTAGPVYVSGDLVGQRNYVGKAITDSERLLQCIPVNQDDVVCFSEGVYRKYRDRMRDMPFTRMGSISDKHQTMHRLYLLEYAH